MQGNFNINIPSIPCGTLKFKIQDVKLNGFASKDARFKEDKSYLTKRFIHSFANLQPKNQTKRTNDSNNNSQVSTNLSSCFIQEKNDFRMIVSENKKNLLMKYQDEFKHYESAIIGENQFKGGYSFSKSEVKDSLEAQINKYHSQIRKQEEKQIDNYYFNCTQQSQSDEQELLENIKKPIQKVRIKPTAAFKSENRWKNEQRIIKSKNKLGPGQYILQKPHRPKQKNIKEQIKNPQERPINIKKIKSYLQDFKDPNLSLILQLNQKATSKQHNSSMFIPDNHDRFGQQIYPISPELNVPGPGAYQYTNNLEQKAKSILILQEQRKLLKQWYNEL